MSDPTVPTQPFRRRTFTPVAPAERPRKHRCAARVVIVCAETVLLLADTDPGIPNSRWWMTPGGGIDPGENAAEAAVREVLEETGLQIGAEQLLGPVAVREVIHGFSDQILTQREDFFVLHLENRFDPTQDGLTEDEQITLDGWSWLPLASLSAEPIPVWPHNLFQLAELVSQPLIWPLDLGVIEESTLPVE
jgi:8-oxo-dGTP pyrophosphatase MutT (NUDIX family)